VRILREGGVTGWELGHPFGPWRIDLAFPVQKVAVEVDGWAWQVDADAAPAPHLPITTRTIEEYRAL
jgi:hypothetical protein